MDLLNKAEVQIWYCAIETLKDNYWQEEASGFLSIPEKEKYKQFRLPKDRDLFLGGRYLLRTGLSEIFGGLKPWEWEFKFNAYGKPSVANTRTTGSISFNLSHCSGMIACAFSIVDEIGIDIERTDRKLKYLEFAGQNFSPEEVAAINNQKKEDQNALFFKYWTLKESFIKAKGLGLQIPLDQFCFRIGENLNVIVKFDEKLNEDPQKWKFHLLNSLDSIQGAIAINSDRDLQIFESFRSIP